MSYSLTFYANHLLLYKKTEAASMKLFTEEEKRLAKAIGMLNYTDPFSPQRLQCEVEILGNRAAGGNRVWHNLNGGKSVNSNLTPIFELAGELVTRAHQRLRETKVSISKEETVIFDQLVIYWLFEKYRKAMCSLMENSPKETHYPFYKEFNEDFQCLINYPCRTVPSSFSPEKTFAMFFQIHRAFMFIFDFIAGGTIEAGKLRSNIWQSIFTYDIYRYQRTLYDKMNLVTTLITGESGTGKELVARAIGLSQFIPFDGKSRHFKEAYPDCFQPIQLSAMPKTIIESELFGHVKGAYTGADSDRKGYMESCSQYGSIFLDEIGEIDQEVQVKLLRLLQNRTFQRLGDTKSLTFAGKILAATNRNLRDSSFRSDLFYRLCSDTITTVPLRHLIKGESEQLRQFIIILAKRIVEGQEALDFADEACKWITENLGLEYQWPGNVRELEQCLRNLLIHGYYQQPSGNSPKSTMRQMLRDCHLTAEQIMQEYMTATFERVGNIARTASAANVDRRTVQKYLKHS